MRLPEDIANLLAVCIRDVLWFKDRVRSFLKGCGVPNAVLQPIPQSEATIKCVHQVLDKLDAWGEKGAPIIQQMLTRMYYWQDMHTVAADRKEIALGSLKAFQEGYKKYDARLRHQQEIEQKTHETRVSRSQVKTLDHSKLQRFRDEFDRVHALTDPHDRGNQFQNLMNEVFAYYCEDSKGAFNRIGEQIDGLFFFDKHWYYVEIRWKKEKANAADVSVLRDRARSAFGGDTKALFVSFIGFSDECIGAMSGQSEERVVLMDGYDLRCVLDCQIAFETLLHEKQVEHLQNKRPFVGANEIIARLRT